jgi:hypothetical protein
MAMLAEKAPLQNEPAPEDVRWFQKELDKIFGRELNGKSRFLIAWGQDLSICREWHPWQKQWRAMFPLSTVRTVDNVAIEGSLLLQPRVRHHDIGVPRWVMLRYVPPEVACLGWVEEGVDQNGHFYDPKPVDGFYEPLRDSILANHTQWCCAAATAANEPCYGSYRAPDQGDLDAVRMYRALMEQQKEQRPGPMTAADYEKARQRASDAREEMHRSMSEQFGAIVTEALNTHQASLSDDPSVQRNGRYHWLSGHNKSGTPKLVNPQGEAIEHSGD